MFMDALNTFSDLIKTSFLVKLPNASEIILGEQYGSPEFQIIINNNRGLQALQSGKELKICEAYIYKDIDLTGKIDMLKLLELTRLFSKEHPFIMWWSKFIYFFKKQTAINKNSIVQHYEFDDAFYLYFLDKTRAYSHGIFINDNETLETANTRKLEFAMKGCQLSPGAKVLDLGAGWGCAVEYLGLKGIHVDAITISQQSAHFVDNLIKDKQLSHCQIFKTDYLEFEPPKKEYYDAIFSLGTLEHLPNYDQVLLKCGTLLRKGGYAYFDASAISSKKLINSDFIHRHIFPGNHQCLDIYRFINSVKKSHFDLISLHNDTHNYYLTLKEWANNLDSHKEDIISRWGDILYRKFQIYLWGCCHAMFNNELQAYRILLKKR